MGTLGVIIAMCVCTCVHMHENVVFTFIPPHTVSYSFLPFRPHFLVTVSCYLYIIYLCILWHISYMCICKHKSMYRNEDEYLSFWIWLILFNMMLSSFIHLWMVLFFAATYNPFIHKPHFPYPFVYCWVSGSILYLDYCHSAAVATDVLVFWFELFCVCASRGTARSYANSVFSVSEEPPHWFP